MGETVVGKPAATVNTSLPGSIRRSLKRGDVSELNASRFAAEPEVVNRANFVPNFDANRSSISLANRPAVQPEVE